MITVTAINNLSLADLQVYETGGAFRGATTPYALSSGNNEELLATYEIGQIALSDELGQAIVSGDATLDVNGIELEASHINALGYYDAFYAAVTNSLYDRTKNPEVSTLLTAVPTAVSSGKLTDHFAVMDTTTTGELDLTSLVQITNVENGASVHFVNAGNSLIKFTDANTGVEHSFNTGEICELQWCGDTTTWIIK